MAFDNGNGKGAVGWTFGNYTVPDCKWGEVVTADDIRYTYLGGVVLQSANGMAFSDEQIKHCIDVSVGHIMQAINIVLVKTRIMSSVSAQGLEKGKDYDEVEPSYDKNVRSFSLRKFFVTNYRPILHLYKLQLLNGVNGTQDLTSSVTTDEAKGELSLTELPRILDNKFRFAMDYDAGYESAKGVPVVLRDAISRYAAVEILKILPSTFTDSKIKSKMERYKSDVDEYCAEMRQKLQPPALGCL